MIDLVYEGLEKPNINKFTPIRNQKDWTKPKGGFWTSPMMKSGISAWRSFCNNDGATRAFATSRWHIVLNKDCRIICVDEDLENVRPYCKKTSSGMLKEVIDFEALSKDYDMVYVSPEVMYKHGNDLFTNFEVPTGLFLNVTNKNGQSLFRALTDQEFESYKAKQEAKGLHIEPIDNYTPKPVDFANDPVLDRMERSLAGEYGPEAQLQALMAIADVFSKRR